MSKSRSFDKTVKVSGSIFVTASLTGLAYATFVASEDNTIELDTVVYVADVEDGGLQISARVSSNTLYLDADEEDMTGRVTYSNDGHSSNMDITVNGSVSKMDAAQWTLIRASLAFTGSNKEGRTYQDIYENLLELNYLTPPNFEDLYNDNTFGTSNAKWTMSSFSSSTWSFELNAGFGWGSFFNYVNPSIFFDSEDTNGYKKGTSYTKGEMGKILDNLYELSGAKYKITLRVLTNENGSSITIDSASGTFSSTGSSSAITYENLLEGDYVYFPKVSRSNYIFNGYTSSSISGVTFEEGKSYELSYLKELGNLTSPVSLSFCATWTSSNATLSVNTTTGSSYATPSFIITVFPSNEGTTIQSKSYSDLGNSGSINLNIGDVLAVSIDTATVKQYSITGVDAEGTYSSSMAYFRITSSSPSIQIFPYPVVSVDITWTFGNYQTSNGGTGYSGADLSDPACFHIVYENGDFDKISYGTNTFDLIEGAKFKVEDYHACSNISVNGGGDSDGYYIASSSTSISITMDFAIKITLSVTASTGTSISANANNFSISVASRNGTSYSWSATQQSYLTSETTSSTTRYIATTDKFKYSHDGNDGPIYDYSQFTSNNDGYYYGSSSGTVTVTGAVYYQSCISLDTPILMGDGSIKAAGELRPGDLVVCYDHEKGKLSVEMVIINAEADWPKREYEVTTLRFEDNREIEIIYEHGFFDLTKNKYVYIHSYDTNTFIGDDFVAVDEGKIKPLKLVSATNKISFQGICSPVSRRHLNIVTAGLLSIAACAHGAFNIFKYEGEDLRFSKRDMEESITKYGLVSREDSLKVLGLHPLLYDMFYADYFLIAIGKRILTWEMLQAYIEQWSEEILMGLSETDYKFFKEVQEDID